MSALPVVVVEQGRHRFVIPLGFVDAQPLRCFCTICARPPSALPGWALWEDDVECFQAAAGAAASHQRRRSKRA